VGEGRGEPTWGLRRLRVPALWNEGLTGKGIRIGHLDTGVDVVHPALAPAVVEFAELDPLGLQLREPIWRDTSHHGTHTAGVIAGRHVGATCFGVAPGAQLVSAIVIDGGDLFARVLGGVEWALARGVRILNLSLGVPRTDAAFLAMSRRIRRRGVLPVFAAGNGGSSLSHFPMACAGALSVGAMTRDDDVWPRDTHLPDLLAPGTDVFSCLPRGGYGELAGTSMAAAHVSGLAALLMEGVPSATVDDVERAILESSAPLRGMPLEQLNCGVPDGPRALERLRAMVREREHFMAGCPS
jgi:subtilisin family serine protease